MGIRRNVIIWIRNCKSQCFKSNLRTSKLWKIPWELGIHVIWDWNGPLDPVSISDKLSYCKILQSLEAARFIFSTVWSLRNLTGTSAAMLLMCLSNFKRCDNSNYQSQSFETSQDLTIRCLIWYWNGAQTAITTVQCWFSIVNCLPNLTINTPLLTLTVEQWGVFSEFKLWLSCASVTAVMYAI